MDNPNPVTAQSLFENPANASLLTTADFTAIMAATTSHRLRQLWLAHATPEQVKAYRAAMNPLAGLTKQEAVARMTKEAEVKP